MFLRFAVQCHNFELRLLWQLYSIAQQWSPVYWLMVDVAVLRGRGALMRSYLDAFRFPFVVSIREWPKEEFAYRGKIRNHQLGDAHKQGNAWVFFADCDNVYSPGFFGQLREALDGELKDETRVISSPRKVHTDTKATDRLVAEGDPSKGSWWQCNALPTVKKPNRRVAAGGMQVFRVREGASIYVPPEKCRDHHLFDRGQRARSDIQFRRRYGGSCMVDLPEQIHLNHDRDKHAGHHLEIQR